MSRLGPFPSDTARGGWGGGLQLLGGFVRCSGWGRLWLWGWEVARVEGSGVDEGGGGWRSCSVLPQPGAALLPFPPRFWFIPSLKERLGGKERGGRSRLRAADPPPESSWEPLAAPGAVGWHGGGCVHYGAERWDPRGAGTSRDVLLGAARGGVQVLVL